MSLIDEGLGSPGQLASTLEAGIESLSQRQQVSFQLYNRVSLTQDGFVFWVATGVPTNFVGSLHVISELPTRIRPCSRCRVRNSCATRFG